MNSSRSPYNADNDKSSVGLQEVSDQWNSAVDHSAQSIVDQRYGLSRPNDAVLNNAFDGSHVVSCQA